VSLFCRENGGQDRGIKTYKKFSENVAKFKHEERTLKNQNCICEDLKCDARSDFTTAVLLTFFDYFRSFERL
jgi:hypothetical protein